MNVFAEIEYLNKDNGLTVNDNPATTDSYLSGLKIEIDAGIKDSLSGPVR